MNTGTQGGSASADSASTIQFVRPGPRAMEWLGEAVRELQAADALRPVAVIVPNHYAGRQARWRLARSGGYVNVRTLLLKDLAAEIAGPSRAGRPLLTPVLEASAVRRAVEEAGGFYNVAEHPALHQTLLGLFRELRRQELDADRLLASARQPTARHALETYRLFRTQVQPFDDLTALRDLATRRLAEAAEIPREMAELGALVLFMPTRLDPADIRLLAAAARWVAPRAAFPDLADPNGPGDFLPRESANALEAALRAQGLAVRAAPPAASAATSTLVSRADVRVIRAPDPAEEVREVVRRLAFDLEHGVPLHRATILYRQPDAYAQLVREALNLAGLRWSALEGISVAESRPGRALLALLRLRDQGFTRQAVLAWIDAEPRPRAGRLPRSSDWDRLSRAANIVRGADQWVSRLRNYAIERRELAERREREGQDGARSATLRDTEKLDAMVAVIEALASALEPPPAGSPWSSFLDWAGELHARFNGTRRGARSGHARDADGSVEDRDWERALPETLEALRQADRFESERGPTFDLFLATLETALESSSRPIGRPGQGVLLGPVQSASGLVFDRVYLLGLTEGAFPPPPAADPFFPRQSDDPLSRRQRRLAAERQAFLSALAAADGGRVTLGTTDSAGGRAAFPSPWLLEVATAQRGGERLHTSAFRDLGEAANPWLRVIRSAQDGLGSVLEAGDTSATGERLSAAADLEDRRLQQASIWFKGGRPLVDHPLAGRADLPLGRALTLEHDRRSAALTVFDGNVAALAARAVRIRKLFDGSGATSASAIQTWATCPFQFFLRSVLKVQPTERPEESWTIDPLEKGKLVHGILERFFNQLRVEGRPNSEPYTPADHVLLEGLAFGEFRTVEARGVAGHPLVWENSREAILADLRVFLAEDERFRRENGLEPCYFEQGFGTGEPGAWPALELNVGARKLRFRGYIDRVDVDPTGGRAYIIDYKTGSASPYGGLERDPLLAGQHLQLALYSRAVQAQLGEIKEIGAAYWFISSKGQFRRLEPGQDRGSVDSRLDEVLNVITGGIEGGVFPQVPGDEDWNDFKNCKFCDYDRVCPAARDQQWGSKQDDPACASYLTLGAPEPAS